MYKIRIKLALTESEVTVVVKLIVNFFNVGEMFRNVVKKLFYTNTLNQKTRQTDMILFACDSVKLCNTEQIILVA